MNSSFCGLLSKVSWVVTALAAINQGLTVFGFNLFMTDFFMNNLVMLFVPLHVVVLAAGVWSLVHFFLDKAHCNK
jgi:hypothetical protein